MPRKPASFLIDSHPELYAQLTVPDPSLSTGSNRRVAWRCPDCNNVFETQVYNRTTKRPTGCPYCSGKKVKAGFNDLATTDPTIAAQLVDTALATQLTRFSNKRLQWRCPTCDHTWTTAVSKRQETGCPACSGRATKTDNALAVTHPEAAALLVDPQLAKRLKAGSNRKVEWRCPTCGHQWHMSVYAFLRAKQIPCPSCREKGAIAYTHPQLAAYLADPKQARELTRRSDRKVTWRCAKGHEFKASVSNQLDDGVRCPVCANKTVIPGVNDVATTHPELAGYITDLEVAKTVSFGSSTIVPFKCNQGHRFALPISRMAGMFSCPTCFKISNTSRFETDVFNSIRKLRPDLAISRHNRKLIAPRELDIYLPELAIAFECDGVMWHSEKYGAKPSDIASKTKTAARHDVTLYHIFEDAWRDQPVIMLRWLASKLHATQNLSAVLHPQVAQPLMRRLYARQLRPTRPSTDRVRELLDAHHILGFAGATYHQGLETDTGELVAVLSLSSPAANRRTSRKDGEWTITRYATACQVVGGFTKCLHAALPYLREAGATSVVTFSDNTTSDGALYAQNGFTFDAAVPPTYSYVGNSNHWRRENKVAYTKSRFEHDPKLLFDPNKTEHELARLNDLYRIYDAGKTRWRRQI